MCMSATTTGSFLFLVSSVDTDARFSFNPGAVVGSVFAALVPSILAFLSLFLPRLGIWRSPFGSVSMALVSWFSVQILFWTTQWTRAITNRGALDSPTVLEKNAIFGVAGVVLLSMILVTTISTGGWFRNQVSDLTDIIRGAQERAREAERKHAKCLVETFHGWVSGVLDLAPGRERSYRSIFMATAKKTALPPKHLRVLTPEAQALTLDDVLQSPATTMFFFCHAIDPGNRECLAFLILRQQLQSMIDIVPASDMKTVLSVVLPLLQSNDWNVSGQMNNDAVSKLTLALKETDESRFFERVTAFLRGGFGTAWNEATSNVNNNNWTFKKNDDEENKNICMENWHRNRMAILLKWVAGQVNALVESHVDAKKDHVAKMVNEALYPPASTENQAGFGFGLFEPLGAEMAVAPGHQPRRPTTTHQRQTTLSELNAGSSGSTLKLATQLRGNGSTLKLATQLRGNASTLKLAQLNASSADETTKEKKAAEKQQATDHPYALKEPTESDNTLSFPRRSAPVAPLPMIAFSSTPTVLSAACIVTPTTARSCASARSVAAPLGVNASVPLGVNASAPPNDAP